MIAVAVLVTQVTSESERGKADARLDAGLDTALATYATTPPTRSGPRSGSPNDPAVGPALRSGDPARIEAVARRRAAQDGIRSLVIRDPSGDVLASIGPGNAVATYELDLTDPGGSLGSLAASTTTASDYLDRVSQLTGRGGALLDGGGTVSSTLALNGASLPSSGESADVEVEGESLRAQERRPTRPRQPPARPARPGGVGGLLLLEPGGRRRPGGVLRRRAGLRDHASAHARRPGAVDARGRTGDRRGRLQPQGAGARRRRDGGPGERVQQDERPPQRPDAGAAPPAGGGRSLGAADRRGVRIGPRSPEPAQDRRRDGAGSVRRAIRDDRRQRSRRSRGRGGGAVRRDARPCRWPPRSMRWERTTSSRARRAASMPWRLRCGRWASRR